MMEILKISAHDKRNLNFRAPEEMRLNHSEIMALNELQERWLSLRAAAKTLGVNHELLKRSMKRVGYEPVKLEQSYRIRLSELLPLLREKL